MYFVVYIDSGRNLFWLELALSFIRQCLVEGLANAVDFSNTLETVKNMRPTNAVLKRQLQKWLAEIVSLNVVAQEDPKVAAGGTSNLQPAQGGLPPAASASAARDASVKEHVVLLLDRWLRVWNSVNDQVFNQYLQYMHQYGVLKTEEAADRFFRVATEICCEACIKSVQPIQQDPAGVLNYTVIDALSKLFLLLVRLADKEATDINVRVNLLSRILNAIARTLAEDHERHKTNRSLGLNFDQRPYFRLLSNLSQDLGVPEPKQEPSFAIFPLLSAYTQVYLALQPSTVPGFAYAWAQLVSRRSFMPNLLLAKGQKGWPYMHRLLSALLVFLQPFLKTSQLNEAIRKLYKGTLRILLVLLHDFPEFLCEFHLSFCDLIPLNCVQLRNLILSAFPRSMRLPDPFMPNLKIDVLTEISQSPRILTDYLAPLTTSGIRVHLDSYLNTKQPAELPGKLHAVLGTSNGSGGYNTQLITSLVIYVGTLAIHQLQSKVPIQNSPAMDIYKQLTFSLDAEGRYILLNTMANQLRYPNSHTHFFSFVILNLFLESEEKEYVQEQITRVLLERLIVHRPHPVRYTLLPHSLTNMIMINLLCSLSSGACSLRSSS
jgi:CCR4-NOT transcription complex subunit 1